MYKAFMDTIVLNAKYPCCGGKCRIVAIVDVPREMYDRKCPKCGTKYSIERKTLLYKQTMLVANYKRVDEVTFCALKPVQKLIITNEGEAP